VRHHIEVIYNRTKGVKMRISSENSCTCLQLLRHIGVVQEYQLRVAPRSVLSRAQLNSLKMPIKVSQYSLVCIAIERFLVSIDVCVCAYTHTIFSA
jgi:hypothetical protein